ncbi:LysE family translocator [Penaeicola halotolerans]|uniref:LysE family translocator n=1 Tax=Penaeicola halotolerans TaxID=2793196 RepID=UPI001CF90EF8|nr:LysE family translocator [Penaeicola halotolerans]
MQALYEGIGMGLLLSVFLGPVFFSLIQNSIQNGFRSGLFMAFGIFTSDTLYVLVTYLGLSQFFENDLFNVILGYAGGGILLVFGLISLLKPVSPTVRPKELQVKNKRLKNFLKGFMLNGINPFVLLFWISMASLVHVKSHFTASDVFVFFAAILVVVLLTDILKAYLAKLLRSYVTPRLMGILNRVVAIVLLIFSIRLFYFAYESQKLLL